MNRTRYEEITSRYARLRIAALGDFCLDRYLEIDPARTEISIETGLPVHNVVRVRSQPGGAGTILNNLVALGVGTIYPIGFVGDDGEAFELLRALRKQPGVDLRFLLSTPERNTFTYCKPLLVEKEKAPVELNRLDTKNWTPTPPAVEAAVMAALKELSSQVEGLIVLDQVDLPDTGVVTRSVLAALDEQLRQHRGLVVLGDSRRHLHRFPAICLKMNRSELGLMTHHSPSSIAAIRDTAAILAQQKQRDIFVTLAEDGIVGASSEGKTEHIPAHAIRGKIDIVGAGDAVTANLVVALSAGANMAEAMAIANAAASVVIHQLGTTGTASVDQIADRLFGASGSGPDDVG